MSAKSARDEALARGKKQWGEPATLRPETEDAYLRIGDQLTTIFHAAAKGDSDATKHLVKLGLDAARKCEMLETFKKLGKGTKSLAKRRATIKRIRKAEDAWPVASKIKRDHGQRDEWRSYVEAGLTVIQLKRAAGEVILIPWN